ncbi:hypothetical protein, partial [Streptomyces sp. A012304]|uniref:hypothetical protein n=1 Tax=Streptomyces sp. A012304 TaxID=375446 RepID=UPI00222F5E4A
MDLDTVADELYGLRPEEFTAARATRMAAARTAGDRALADRIGKLRRPSRSAWASNLLVRERPDEIEPLLRLGQALRQAHHDLDGTQLRALVRRQRQLVGALARQAGELTAAAGHPIGEDARREVESTLHAVLADEDAARAWATGRLVKPLTPAVGFPEVADTALRRTPAPPPPPRPPARLDDKRRERLTRARQAAREADDELRDRQREARSADRAATEAGEETDRLRRRVD